MFKLVLEKAEEPQIKLPTSAGSSKKQECFTKNIYFCFIDYAKAFDCVDHNKLWKILQEMGIPDLLTCLLINKKHSGNCALSFLEKISAFRSDVSWFTQCHRHRKGLAFL